MKKISKILLCLGTMAMAYLLTYFALTFIAQKTEKVYLQIIALAVAISLSIYLWIIIKDASKKLIGNIFTTTLIIGAAGFGIGFIVIPLIFMPGNNLGPLLGLFITGPLSLVFGVLIGCVYWQVKRRKGEI